MKIIWELLLKLSSTAASKLYGSDVIQVDIHLENGKKLMIMSQEESDKLRRCTELLIQWKDEDIAELKKKIDRLHTEIKHG